MAINLTFLKNEEGLRLQEYRCQAGRRTIGYGHACAPDEHYPSGITKEKAEELLLQDVKEAVSAVRKYLPNTPLNDNQMTALVSLVFNCGAEPLRLTLGQLLRKAPPNYDGAADVFLWWCKYTDPTTKKLKKSAGLTARRTREAALFKKEPAQK
jgi:lysozyme